MKDPQKLRHEARGFLDKAKITPDNTVRRVLLERALRLAQMAGMLEQAAEMSSDEGRLDESTRADSAQAVIDGMRRRA